MSYQQEQKKRKQKYFNLVRSSDGDFRCLLNSSQSGVSSHSDYNLNSGHSLNSDSRLNDSRQNDRNPNKQQYEIINYLSNKYYDSVQNKKYGHVFIKTLYCTNYNMIMNEVMKMNISKHIINMNIATRNDIETMSNYDLIIIQNYEKIDDSYEMTGLSPDYICRYIKYSQCDVVAFSDKEMLNFTPKTTFDNVYHMPEVDLFINDILESLELITINDETSTKVTMREYSEIKRQLEIKILCGTKITKEVVKVICRNVRNQTPEICSYYN